MFGVAQDSPWAELFLFQAFTQTEQQPKSPPFRRREKTYGPKRLQLGKKVLACRIFQKNRK